ncbi:hypothetical protein SAMN05192543_110183 [Paraburkholderia megapolitana]|uniref:Uncharacterized protein n=1 Tax=Paraburkholderia megapolitana TaxID=420953 RepID=A0A1I3TYM3_9BURK|nr:hypothetical protein SAMN05192543_110183 [Paraburkholderia megapolitana]
MWDPGLFCKWSSKPPLPMSGGFRPGFTVWALFVVIPAAFPAQSADEFTETFGKNYFV